MRREDRDIELTCVEQWQPERAAGATQVMLLSEQLIAFSKVCSLTSESSSTSPDTASMHVLWLA